MHPVGSALFLTAVLANFVLIASGVVITLVVSFRRGYRAAAERHAAAFAHQAAYHRPDPVTTPLFERVFMFAATTLVLVGLPVALAAVFKFVVPLLGHGWTP